MAATVRAHRATPQVIEIVRGNSRTAGASAEREKAIKRMARVIATSPHFSTNASFEDFVVNRRK